MRPAAWALLAAACLALSGPTVRAQTASGPIVVVAKPAPMEPRHPDRQRLGALTYAGGLVLTSPGTEGFGSLSGLDVMPDGRFVAQSDFGDLLTGRIVLDAQRRLAGIEDAGWARLTDEQGRPFTGPKDDADAEGVTYLPGGGFAVSFEQHPRVEAYAGVGPGRPLGVPAAAAGFPPNTGLEALTVWTNGQGRERLVEGSEDGRAWSCDMAGKACVQILDRARDGPGKDFALTGLDALDAGGMVAVYRAFDLIRGARAKVFWLRPDAPRKLTELATIAPPYTVDNMEGIAAVRSADGSIRLYLVSDDNLSKAQRTILLAFDWSAAAR
jgi:hypothetical protein